MNIPRRYMTSGFVLLLTLFTATCAEKGSESRTPEQTEVTATLDSVQAQLSKEMQRVDDRITELRRQAESAAAAAGGGAADEYGARADQLQEAKDRIQARWEQLKNNAADNWDQARKRADELLADTRSLLDSASSGSPTP